MRRQLRAVIVVTALSASAFVALAQPATSLAANKAATGLFAYPAGKAFLGLGPTTFHALLYQSPSLAPLAGAKISFTVGSKVVCTAITTGSGDGTCKGQIGVFNSIVAKTYTVTFAGNALYLGSTAIGAFA